MTFKTNRVNNTYFIDSRIMHSVKIKSGYYYNIIQLFLHIKWQNLVQQFGQVDWSEEKQSATIGTEKHTFLPFNVVLNELGD